MIDYDLNKIKILPADHIALQDFDYAVGIEKKNKILEQIILGAIAAGVITLIYYVIKDAETRDKQKQKSR